MTLICASKLDRVVVHARGAIVSRLVEVPDSLPDGVVDLVVPGITPRAESGTFRAAASERTVVSVRSALFVPSSGAVPGPSVERVRAVAARFARLESHVRVLRARRERLADLALDPALAIRSHAGRGKDRIAESLAAAELLRRWLEDCDDRLADLAGQLEDLARERDAAQLSDRQASSSDRMGAGHPELQATIRLEGSGAVRTLRLDYVVMAARWWPVYTIRLTATADRAAWLMEGLVAQLTGEDWTSVHLSLSTSDLIFDARLPELSSLRLGRAQPRKSPGYRLPPPDLEAMFAAYDAGFAVAPPSAAPEPEASFASTGAVELEREARGKKKASVVRTPVPSALLAPPSPARMAPPLPAAAVMPSMPMAAPSAGVERGAVSGGYAGAAPQALAEDLDGYAAFDGPAPPPPPEPEIEPAEGWMDFDSLRMAGPTDRSTRGRLRRDSAGALQAERSAAARKVDAVDPGLAVRDPAVTRGLFDIRYPAEGTVGIPSDARAHRVTIGAAEGPSELRYRAVPREAREVYRELRATNPFLFPLLDGPADVYMDGSLAACAALSRLGVGGVTRAGLGVEERLRVARNVRVEEETTGLLGGGTAVHHTVSMDLSSSIRAKATVEVLDRMPDTDDKDVEIKLGSSTPPASRYTQAELGAPIRGGLSWVVELAPGGAATIEYRYRISFSSKSELVGGNRRD